MTNIDPLSSLIDFWLNARRVRDRRASGGGLWLDDPRVDALRISVPGWCWPYQRRSGMWTIQEGDVRELLMEVALVYEEHQNVLFFDVSRGRSGKGSLS